MSIPEPTRNALAQIWGSVCTGRSVGKEPQDVVR
jgi:hypothetical protein